MPPIQLSRSERASLKKLFAHPIQLDEIPADHQEKFINYDLVRKNVLLLYITPLGHIELLRQRFRDLKPAEAPKAGLLPSFRRPQLLTDRAHGGA